MAYFFNLKIQKGCKFYFDLILPKNEFWLKNNSAKISLVLWFYLKFKYVNIGKTINSQNIGVLSNLFFDVCLLISLNASEYIWLSIDDQKYSLLFPWTWARGRTLKQAFIKTLDTAVATPKSKTTIACSEFFWNPASCFCFLTNLISIIFVQNVEFMVTHNQLMA